MELFEASLIALAFTQWERVRLPQPSYVRDIGAVIETEGLVQASGDIVGYLDGRPIHAAVDFMGMRYRFENVVPPSYRHRVGPRELYVVPGLLYVTD